MTLQAAVLNASCAAATALFDSVSLGTGPLEADEDTGIANEALTWTSPSAGVSTASATFEAIEGDWTHLLLWNSTTFVGSVAREISFDVASDLVVALEHSVVEDA
jgi:hypothetical protein